MSRYLQKKHHALTSNKTLQTIPELTIIHQAAEHYSGKKRQNPYQASGNNQVKGFLNGAGVRTAVFVSY